MATEDTIEFNVRCLGCEKMIARPSEADMELFRQGLRVHNDNDCREMLAAKLIERKVRV